MSAASYARAALDAECATLAATRRGRNAQANRSGFAMGQLVGAGMLDRGEVLNSLLTAATTNGYVAQDGIGAARASILSGFSSGLRKPRAVPDERDRAAASARPSATRPFPVPALMETADKERHAERVASANRLWNRARDAHGSLAERYINSRGLDLPDGADVLRYYARTPWRDDDGSVIFVGCMIAAMRAIDGDALVAVQRTALQPDGTKIGRRYTGVAAGAAIKLTPDEDVTHGLAIGEGLETCMSAMALGIKPCWATGSSGGIARFPALPGIEALTVLGEAGAAFYKALVEVSARWLAAGREIAVLEPTVGSDMNNSLREVA